VKRKTRKKFQSIVRAWFEAFIGFEIVMHFKDLIKPDVLIQAAIAAIFPIIFRWINPKDTFPDGE
jgi:hypothetical protein